MLSVQIKNQKDFTSRLFTGDSFDKLLLDNAQFRVFADFTIDGRVNASYFDSDDNMKKLPFLPWGRFRNICFQIIKGTQKPVSFKIILKLDSASVQQFEQTEQISTVSCNISGLYLNIRYDAGNIFCTSGIAYSVFSMDKTAEMAFDRYIQKYLIDKNIDFNIC